jgi:hypothetical protein
VPVLSDSTSYRIAHACVFIILPLCERRSGRTAQEDAMETIAGVEIPDTPLVSDATAFVRDVENDLLFDHSRRVFLFGALHGQRMGLDPDPELLYVGALFHDLGLTPEFATRERRFEIDSAHVARTFLCDHGRGERDASRVFLAIALHTTPNIPQFLEPEVALVTAGVETDVLGFGLRDLDARLVAEVTAAHPRPGFKPRILAAFADGNAHRPDTTFGNVNADVLERFSPGFTRANFVDIIQQSAWPE